MWWQKNRQYWKLVRAAWSSIYENNTTITVINDKVLYQSLFKLNEDYNTRTFSDKDMSDKIYGAIMQNLKASVK